MKLHIIMHESFESPAAIETWAISRNYSLSYTRLYNHDSFPEATDFDFLVIMGGPQSPATTRDECSYFDSAKEKEFIKKVIDSDKLVLGVCLGAQFIGEALGASFDHSPNREIGIYDITLTEEGKSDPLFKSFPDKLKVGNWHGDMPGLTSESKVLAISDGCPRQIVRYSPKIYGFQCHFEFNRDAVEGMIKNCGNELEEYKNLPYIDTADDLVNHDYNEMNSFLFKFLDEFVKC